MEALLIAEHVHGNFEVVEDVLARGLGLHVVPVADPESR